MKSMLATLLFSMLLSITIAASVKDNVRYLNQLSARQYGERVLKSAKKSSHRGDVSAYHRQMVESAGTTGVDKTEDDDDDSIESGDDDSIENGDDDQTDDSTNGMSGKGGKGTKGKGGKGSDSGGGADDDDDDVDNDDDVDDDSMNGSSGKGFLSKKSKRGSSTKDNDRLSYKGSKKGSAVAPTPTAPGSPDGSPSSPTESPGNSDDASTTNGGSSESVEVPADTFQLDYTLSENRAPTTEDFEQMAQLTSTYLEEYMRDVFGDGLALFSTFMIFQEYQDGQPVRVDYRSIGTFAGDFDSIPTTADLNALINSAFSNPDLEGYLARFNSLPSSNVFQTTSGVVQQAAAQASGESSHTLETAIGAGAGALLLLAAAKYASSRRKETKEADSAEKLNGEGSDAGTIGEGDQSATGWSWGW